MTEGVRKHQRVDRNIDVVWAIEARQLSGRGKIVNLSLSGACIKLDPSFVGKPVKAAVVRAGALTEVAITIGERPRRAE